MQEGSSARSAIVALAFALVVAAVPGRAQETQLLGLKPTLPGEAGYAPPTAASPLATAAGGRIVLTARLTESSPELTRGLVWRIFGPEVGEDGKLPLVASAAGGTSAFDVEPGSYLIHAAFGRAGATKRVSVGRDERTEDFVLDAGGLKLDATLPGGAPIAASKLRFSIYESVDGGEGELIIPNVSPNTVVGLNAGVYHVESNYGSVNAVIRSNIRVEPGKLTEATVEHRAAQLTLKLVREPGGEAMAETSWSILTGSGDLVREIVGPYATMVLAEGEYTFIAKNRDRIYQRDYTVVPGKHDSGVEVVTTEHHVDIQAAGRATID